MKWDEYFIKMTMLVASKSKDPSTQVGCVIVGPDNEVRSTGYNGFPRGVAETTDVRQHAPVEVVKTWVGQYQAVCSCGDVVVIGGANVSNWDMLPDDPYAMKPTKDLQADINNHPHFTAPEIVLHPERWERPLKYDFVEHAERNAVYNAARVGIPLQGCRAYLNWEPLPCKDCTKAFIQAGIVEIIGPDIEFPSHGSGKDVWKLSVSETMLIEAGVTYRKVPWIKE